MQTVWKLQARIILCRTSVWFLSVSFLKLSRSERTPIKTEWWGRGSENCFSTSEEDYISGCLLHQSSVPIVDAVTIPDVN